MITRALAHLRRNTVAYVALFFAVGGGGVGAAIAETTAGTTIHACVSKKTGELFIVKRCGKTTRALTFNQRGPVGATGAPGATGAAGPAGTPAVVAFGQVGDNGGVGVQRGMTITEVSTGLYNVTITASACANSPDNVPVVSPFGGPTAAGSESGIPVAWTDPSETSGVTFQVQAGDVQSGNFVASDEGFDIQDQC